MRHITWECDTCGEAGKGHPFIAVHCGQGVEVRNRLNEFLVLVGRYDFCSHKCLAFFMRRQFEERTADAFGLPAVDVGNAKECKLLLEQFLFVCRSSNQPSVKELAKRVEKTLSES